MIPLNSLIGTLAPAVRPSLSVVWEQALVRAAGWVADSFRRSFVQEGVLLACCVVIGLVSSYDGYLTIRYHESLAQMEINPMGRLLLNLDETSGHSAASLARFLGLKFAGTVIVICALQAIFRGHRRIGMTCAIVVALVQLSLGWFLVYGEHSMLASLVDL